LMDTKAVGDCIAYDAETAWILGQAGR
jgi:hypothetical protein